MSDRQPERIFDALIVVKVHAPSRSVAQARLEGVLTDARRVRTVEVLEVTIGQPREPS